MITLKSFSVFLIFAFLIIAGVYGISKLFLSYEAAYPKTPAGKVEIKRIPESMLISTEKEGNYFDRGNELFSRLFSYISENKVSMTVPVEAEISSARMKFYVGSADREKDLRDRSRVRVITEKQRIVVSCGMRGSYSRENFEKGRKKLEKWLRENPAYRAAGEPYAVYWNSPFVPWFLKRSEVHIPVSEQQ